MTMGIKVFKLISGEELIADVFNNYDQFFELKTAATIMIQQTEKGLGVALMPYMPYSKGNIKLYKQSIASESEPDLNMSNEFNRLYGSGLVTAPASALASLGIK